MCDTAAAKLLIMCAINFPAPTDASSHSLVGANLSSEKGSRSVSATPPGRGGSLLDHFLRGGLCQESAVKNIRLWKCVHFCFPAALRKRQDSVSLEEDKSEAWSSPS